MRLKKIRKKVIDRDGLICCYCENFLLLNDVTMEHIVPISKRGTFNTTNLTVACKSCNNKRDNQPFFKFCKNFSWSQSKIDKYKKLYYDNLKIKILNIAKEFCIEDIEKVIPEEIITKSCLTLKVKSANFDSYFKVVGLDSKEIYTRKVIKFSFEEIIKIIEAETL